MSCWWVYIDFTLRKIMHSFQLRKIMYGFQFFCTKIFIHVKLRYLLPGFYLFIYLFFNVFTRLSFFIFNFEIFLTLKLLELDDFWALKIFRLWTILDFEKFSTGKKFRIENFWLWKFFNFENFLLWKNFDSDQYSALKNFQLWKMFNSEKCTTLKNIQKVVEITKKLKIF